MNVQNFRYIFFFMCGKNDIGFASCGKNSINPRWKNIYVTYVTYVTYKKLYMFYICFIFVGNLRGRPALLDPKNRFFSRIFWKGKKQLSPQ